MLITILTISIELVLVTIIIGKINLSLKFKKEVKQLFSLSGNISNKIFKEAELTCLPEPVQRYFKNVLTDGKPYISYARITHDGKFKTGKDKPWINIRGEQYATTSKPGFIWKGVTSFFTARDMYISDKGRLVVSLLSFINIVDARGNAYNQGELLRWLGESVMYPTNLLPDDKLKWKAIDEFSAKVTFNYKGLHLFFVALINDMGEITQLETNRYMDEKNLEKWVIKIGDYKTLNQVRVPTRFEVLWRLQNGDFSYAKFNIRKIEYDNPIIF